jgi:hypothetical protein
MRRKQWVTSVSLAKHRRAARATAIPARRLHPCRGHGKLVVRSVVMSRAMKPTTLCGFVLAMATACGGQTASPGGADSGTACALGACPPTTLVSGQPGASWISADAANVYFATHDGGVMQCGAGGCNNNPILLASGQTGPTSIAVDASNVYWTTGDGNVMVCAIFPPSRALCRLPSPAGTACSPRKDRLLAHGRLSGLLKKQASISSLVLVARPTSRSTLRPQAPGRGSRRTSSASSTGAACSEARYPGGRASRRPRPGPDGVARRVRGRVDSRPPPRPCCRVSWTGSSGPRSILNILNGKAERVERNTEPLCP